MFWEYKVKKEPRQEINAYLQTISGQLTDAKKITYAQIIYHQEHTAAYGLVRFSNPLWFAESFINNNPDFVFVAQLEELEVIKNKQTRPHEFLWGTQIPSSPLRKNMEKLLLLI
jgi:hypothetical protein